MLFLSRFVFMFAVSQSPLAIASHADVFRGSSRVPSGAGTRDEPRLNPHGPDYLGYLCGGESLAPQKVVNTKRVHGPAN